MPSWRRCSLVAPLRRWRQTHAGAPLPLGGLLSSVLLTFVLAPALVLMALHGRDTMAAAGETLSRRVGLSGDILDRQITRRLATFEQAVDGAARRLGDLPAGADEDVQDVVLHLTAFLPNVRRAYLVDASGKLLGVAPRVGKGLLRIGWPMQASP